MDAAQMQYFYCSLTMSLLKEKATLLGLSSSNKTKQQLVDCIVDHQLPLYNQCASPTPAGNLMWLEQEDERLLHPFCKEHQISGFGSNMHMKDKKHRSKDNEKEEQESASAAHKCQLIGAIKQHMDSAEVREQLVLIQRHSLSELQALLFQQQQEEKGTRARGGTTKLTLAHELCVQRRSLQHSFCLDEFLTQSEVVLSLCLSCFLAWTVDSSFRSETDKHWWLHTTWSWQQCVGSWCFQQTGPLDGWLLAYSSPGKNANTSTAVLHLMVITLFLLSVCVCCERLTYSMCYMLGTDELCVICYASSIEIIMLPCRHAICHSCSVSMVKTRRRKCPFCNQRIQKIWSLTLL